MPRCRTSHFPFLNFMRFFSALFSFLSRSLWKAVHPSGVLATPSSFVLSMNLLKVHFVPSYKSLMRLLDSTGPSVDSWDTPPVACLQLDFVPLFTTLSVWPFLFSIHLTVHWSKPYIVSLSMRMLKRDGVKGLTKVKIAKSFNKLPRNDC